MLTEVSVQTPIGMPARCMKHKGESSVHHKQLYVGLLLRSCQLNRISSTIPSHCVPCSSPNNIDRFIRVMMRKSAGMSQQRDHLTLRDRVDGFSAEDSTWPCWIFPTSCGVPSSCPSAVWNTVWKCSLNPGTSFRILFFRTLFITRKFSLWGPDVSGGRRRCANVLSAGSTQTAV